MKTYAEMSDRQLKQWMKDNPVKTELSTRDRLLKKTTAELEDLLLELKSKYNPDSKSIYLHDPMTRKKISDVEWAIHKQGGESNES
ncbi:MAG: hypothetical protein KAQ89_00295 [Planctomycetes bacterium]|nr:hypothetical protein [Planctomycetota bacterium]